MIIVINKHIYHIGFSGITKYTHISDKQEPENWWADFGQTYSVMHKWENLDLQNMCTEMETNKSSFKKCLIMAKAYVKCWHLNN